MSHYSLEKLRVTSYGLRVTIILVGLFFFWLLPPLRSDSADPLPPPPPQPVTGWLWSAHALVNGRAQGMGWISLNSSNTMPGEWRCFEAATQTKDCYGVAAKLDQASGTGRLTGYAWSPALEWICFGSTCSGSPPSTVPPFFTTPLAKIVPIPDDAAHWRLEGWAKIINLGDNGWMHLGPGTVSGAGILIDRQSKEWSGYVWNASQGASRSGIGWFWPKAHGGIIAQPWVETTGGDIYSGRNVRAVPPVAPAGLYNAAYVIQASGSAGIATIDWISQSGSQFPVINPNSLIKTLPAVTDGFATPLGRIDFSGLQAGQYGEVVIDPPQIPSALAGKVYIIPHDLVLPNQALAAGGGAGTIIVEGDLTITSDINYAQPVITRTQDIPSLAWIVLGDIHIQTGVSRLDGTMIALGNGSSCATGASHCGQIFTGTTDTPLTVRGALFAQRFNFQRTGRFLDRGSEQIIFDGRLFSNPPPGLQDLVRGLPVWKQK